MLKMRASGKKGSAVFVGPGDRSDEYVAPGRNAVLVVKGDCSENLTWPSSQDGIDDPVGRLWVAIEPSKFECGYRE
jgi:hypothetical protein